MRTKSSSSVKEARTAEPYNPARREALLHKTGLNIYAPCMPLMSGFEKLFRKTLKFFFTNESQIWETLSYQARKEFKSNAAPALLDLKSKGDRLGRPVFSSRSLCPPCLHFGELSSCCRHCFNFAPHNHNPLPLCPLGFNYCTVQQDSCQLLRCRCLTRYHVQSVSPHPNFGLVRAFSATS